MQIRCGTYSSTQYVLNYTRLEAYFSFHINALVRINIVRRFYYLGKTISFTSTPDYLGVLTRSAFAGLAQTKKDLGLVDLNLCFVIVINVMCNMSKVLIYRIKYFVLNRINEFSLLQQILISLERMVREP
mgnify:CR=1 FL=1